MVLAEESQDYIVRNATLSDIPQVMRINRENLPENYSEDFFRDILLSNRESFYVAEVGGKLVGYIMCRVEFGFSVLGSFSLTKKGHVISIAVDKEHRRKGIGRTLMMRALGSLREKGCKEVYLEVRVSNMPAIRLYESLGFRIVKRVAGYYRDGEDAFIMARRL